jgi:hypothetical protein
MPGEYHTSGNQCNECSFGTFSYDWNSTECTNCIDDSICLGGAHVEVYSGYWRRRHDSTMTIKCPNEDACLGGYNLQNEVPVS